MEERGLGEPGANSTVREEWEPKGLDVIQNQGTGIFSNTRKKSF